MAEPSGFSPQASVPAISERLAMLMVWLVALLVIGLCAWLFADIAWRGVGRLSWAFLTEPPADAGRSGGIGPILLSTGLIVAVALAAATPIALGTAVLLAEFVPNGSRFGRFVARSLDMLSSVPSIVFGLFGNAFFCIYLGMGFSIVAGGLTLACMALPILISTAEAGLRSAPDDYRLAAAGLGLSRTATLVHLLLPAATPALVAGLMLGIGRAMAETAALIFTSGYVDRMPSSLFDSGRALSVHIYDLSMNVAGGDATASAAALVLMGWLLIINYTAHYLASGWKRRKMLET